MGKCAAHLAQVGWPLRVAMGRSHLQRLEDHCPVSSTTTMILRIFHRIGIVGFSVCIDQWCLLMHNFSWHVYVRGLSTMGIKGQLTGDIGSLTKLRSLWVCWLHFEISLLISGTLSMELVEEIDRVSSVPENTARQQKSFEHYISHNLTIFFEHKYAWPWKENCFLFQVPAAAWLSCLLRMLVTEVINILQGSLLQQRPHGSHLSTDWKSTEAEYIVIQWILQHRLFVHLFSWYFSWTHASFMIFQDPSRLWTIWYSSRWTREPYGANLFVRIPETRTSLAQFLFLDFLSSSFLEA